MKKNIAVILLSIIFMSGLYSAFELLVPVQTDNRNVEIEIPKGSTFRQAAEILAEQKFIRDARIFLLLGRLTGADRKIRAGYYSIWSSMSPLDIFKIILKGRIIEYEIKVLEGDSIYEVADAFAKTGIITTEDFLRLSRDPEFLSSHNIPAPSVEGYIFPDTYIIPKGVKAEDALGSMIDRMDQKFSGDLQKRAEKIGMTKGDVLTLASIIEKEAIEDSERPMISAVYHNRLRKKMQLQADPTSIYGLKRSSERITLSDLRRKTPYNTYLIKGLPPGPIASPGLKSIIAALHPADVPYLYFVSNNDGTHVFSVTIAEHEEAVKAYRDKRKSDEEAKKEEE